MQNAHSGMPMGSDNNGVTEILGTSAPAEHAVVYLQLRPSRAGVTKCIAELQDLLTEHPDVPVSIDGVARDDRNLFLTLAVDAGPAPEVSRFSDAAKAAYGFSTAVFQRLFNHLPRYVAQPSASEHEAAVAFVARYTALAEPVQALAS